MNIYIYIVNDKRGPAGDSGMHHTNACCHCEENQKTIHWCFFEYNASPAWQRAIKPHLQTKFVKAGF